MIRFIDPVMSGDYPQRMKEQVEKLSREDGLEASRLPVFSEEEKSVLKGFWQRTLQCSGSIDFLGVNYYMGLVVKDETGKRATPHGMVPNPDIQAHISYREEWPMCVCLHVTLAGPVLPDG